MLRGPSLAGYLPHISADLRRILRGAGATFVVRVAATIVAYAALIAFARWMGASEYGAYTYALSWGYLLALPAGLGLPTSSIRFLPQYAAAESWSSVRGFVGRTALLTIVSSTAMACVAIAFILLAGDRFPAAYRVPVIITLAGLPALALLVLGSQIGRSLGWIVIAYAPAQLLHPLLLLAIGAALVVNGVQLTARNIALAAVAVSIACLLLQVTLYLRRLWPHFRGVTPSHEQGQWLRVAGPLFVSEAFAAVLSYTDVLMIGIFLSPAHVAYYFAATRTAALVTFFFTSISALAAPRMSELHSQGRKEELQALLSGIAPWMGIPAAAVTIVLAAGGGILLPLFGEGFEAGWIAMVLLAIGNLVISLNGPAAMLLNVTGHQDTTAKVYALGAAANIGLNLLLIPGFGIAGAAFATMLTIAAIHSSLAVVTRRKLGITIGLTVRSIRQALPVRAQS